MRPSPKPDMFAMLRNGTGVSSLFLPSQEERRRVVDLTRRMLLLLAVAMLALMVVAGTALAAAGGKGQRIGGGNFANPYNGKHTATGGGQPNNPNLCGLC